VTTGHATSHLIRNKVRSWGPASAPAVAAERDRRASSTGQVAAGIEGLGPAWPGACSVPLGSGAPAAARRPHNQRAGRFAWPLQTRHRTTHHR